MAYQHSIVILDRDGVINEDSDHYIKSEEEWIPIPGSLESMARLSDRGFRLGVATNQSGLARNLFDEFALARMHEKMSQQLAELGGRIDALCYCPHSPDAQCDCRKPGTGLLRQLSIELDADLTGAAFIGDSLKDLQAAISFGMEPVLVRTGKGSETEKLLGELPVEIKVFDSLCHVVDRYLLPA